MISLMNKDTKHSTARQSSETSNVNCAATHHDAVVWSHSIPHTSKEILGSFWTGLSTSREATKLSYTEQIYRFFNTPIIHVKLTSLQLNMALSA